MRKRVIAGLVLVVIAILITVATQKLQLDSLTKEVAEGINNIGISGIDIPIDEESAANVEYKFAVLSDSHGDTEVYPSIIDEIANRSDLRFIAHLGDHGNGGEISELRSAKMQLDRISAPVYVLPGDHDLNWLPQRDSRNFQQVFGLRRTTYGVEVDDEYYIFIDASDSNNGVSLESWAWLEAALDQYSQKNIYVFMSTPLSNPFITFKEMGSQNDTVKDQAQRLATLLKKHHVRAVFAGDTHTYSQYEDADTGIPIITVGAAGTNKNPLPLYVVVEILSDGGYNVTSIPYYKNNNQ